MSDRDATRRERPVIVDSAPESLRTVLDGFDWDAPLEDDPEDDDDVTAR